MCIYSKTDDLKLMICFIYDKNPAVDSAAGFASRYIEWLFSGFIGSRPCISLGSTPSLIVKKSFMIFGESNFSN